MLAVCWRAATAASDVLTGSEADIKLGRGNRRDCPSRSLGFKAYDIDQWWTRNTKKRGDEPSQFTQLVHHDGTGHATSEGRTFCLLLLLGGSSAAH